MSKSAQYQSSRDFTRTVTIVVGETESTPLDTYGCEVVGIIIDANLTGTKLTFKTATTNSSTYVPYYTNDTAVPPLEKEVQLTVSPSRQYGFGRQDLTGIQFIKLVSGTTQDTNDSVITLILRP